eukprot:751004-Hanusia_phi.AAC.6
MAAAGLGDETIITMLHSGTRAISNHGASVLSPPSILSYREHDGWLEGCEALAPKIANSMIPHRGPSNPRTSYEY